MDNKNNDVEEHNQLDCIGVDNKIHVCISWESKTSCGIKIKQKNISPTDRLHHFSCYECTY
jgi:hypothetical protein